MGTTRPVDSGEVGAKGQRIMISEAEAARRAGAGKRAEQAKEFAGHGDHVLGYRGKMRALPSQQFGNMLSFIEDPDLLRAAHDQGDWVADRYMAGNESCPPDVLSDLAANGGGPDNQEEFYPNRWHNVRAIAAANPSCPVEAIDDILGDPVCEQQAEEYAAATNPNAPVEAAYNIAARDFCSPDTYPDHLSADKVGHDTGMYRSVIDMCKGMEVPEGSDPDSVYRDMAKAAESHYDSGPGPKHSLGNCVLIGMMSNPQVPVKVKNRLARRGWREEPQGDW